MKEVFDKLFEEQEKAKETLDNINTAIDKLRDNCPHEKWEWDGNDSHYDYEKCVVCRESRKA